MRSIDGKMLKSMFISASNNLFNHYPEIDSLNVFPVPDGDTGMNMNLTMSSGAKEIANKELNSAHEIAKSFSRGLLMGARGNSGVITSQIFRGFAEGISGLEIIRAVDLANAFYNGNVSAYKAVLRPVEGTILTVIRESAEVLRSSVKEDMSIEECMKIIVKEAHASLQRTPELLAVLKEVGVVDSGGAGLCVILEGMQSAIDGVVIEKSNEAETTFVETNFATKGSEGEFGYCTEFILRIDETDKTKKTFVEKRFTNVLLSHGDSVAIVRDEDILKVHIHTLKPGNILTYAQQFGEFVSLKIENMSEQHSELTNTSPQKTQVAAAPQKENGVIAVSSGKGIDSFFKQLGVDYIVSGGQTMNPSTEDFLEAIKKVNAKNIFILPNNSNIVMAASQACDVIEEDVNAMVVPSKTIPQGLVSMMRFSSEFTPEKNLSEMKSALKTVQSGSITYAIKDTDIEGVHVIKDHYIAIKDKVIVSCVKDKIDAFYNLLESMIDDDSSMVTVLCGEDIKEEEMTSISSKLEEKYSDIEFDIQMGDQPVYSFLIGVE